MLILCYNNLSPMFLTYIQNTLQPQNKLNPPKLLDI